MAEAWETTASNDEECIYLMPEEIKDVADALRCIIYNNVQSWKKEEKNGMDEEELNDYFKEIAEMCTHYLKLTNPEDGIVLSKEDAKNFAIDLDFGIFDMIRQDEDIDNTYWLSNVMSVWRKMAKYSDCYGKLFD